MNPPIDDSTADPHRPGADDQAAGDAPGADAAPARERRPPDSDDPLSQLTGDEPASEAISLLVEAHGARLAGLARRFCRTPEEAEDLVQETFLTAFRRWETFEGRSHPATWLWTIAARLCQRMHRKRVGEPEHVASLDVVLPFAEPTVPDVPDDGDPLSAGIRKEATAQVEAAIARLPMDFRMPLVLKEIVGLSVADVAAALGVKEATVKTRLHRARLKLREAVERPLPRVEAAPTPYTKAVCLDLLAAKQEALDRGVEFELPGDPWCARCASVFATLDLVVEGCGLLSDEPLSKEMRARLDATLASGA